MSAVAVVVFLGPPGSGKGTQAKNLCQQQGNWVHISTGDLFRAEIASQSPLGNSVKEILASGKLVSDEVTCDVFESQVKKILSQKTPQLMILDGFPRTGPQTEFLKKFVAQAPNLCGPDYILFEIQQDTVIDRVTHRWVNPRTGRVYHDVLNPPQKAGVCDEDGGPLVQREDDKPETIRARFQLYQSQLAQILEKVPAPALHKVQAEGTPQEVLGRLSSCLSGVLKKGG